MKQHYLWVMTVALALGLSVSFSDRAEAGDTERSAGAMPILLAANGDQDRDRIMDQLRTDLSLSDGEVQRLRERVGHHLNNGGTEQNLRRMMQVSLRNGCRDQCLEDAVRAMNREMHQGMSVTKSRERVEKAIRSAAASGDSKGMAERLRDRLELRERDAVDWDRPMRDPRGDGLRGGGGRR